MPRLPARLSDGAAGRLDQLLSDHDRRRGAHRRLHAARCAPLANGVSGNVVLTAPVTKVITADAKWTYSYANTTTPPAGTYGGTWRTTAA